MIFNEIIKNIKEKILTKNEENLTDPLVKELEVYKSNFETIPFKIIEIKKKCFLIEVNGVIGLISFYRMPWSYINLNSWSVIYPKLINNDFLCKIFEIRKNPQLVFIDGKIPQFKKIDLIEGQVYKAVIIKIAKYGFFIELGHHFNWQCGSIVGLLHKSQLRKTENFDDFKLGNELETFYNGLNKNEQLVFSNDSVKSEWNCGVPQELVGHTIIATVSRKHDFGNVRVLVKGKYEGVLFMNKENYTTKYRKKITKAMRELENGEKITCVVKEAITHKRILHVDWLVERDTDLILYNSISNNLDNGIFQKLSLIKEEEVTINKH